MWPEANQSKSSLIADPGSFATFQLRALSNITNPLYVPSFLVLYFMDDKITKLRVYGTQELIEYR